MNSSDQMQSMNQNVEASVTPWSQSEETRAAWWKAVRCLFLILLLLGGWTALTVVVLGESGLRKLNFSEQFEDY
jgi:hypothetical protein